MAAAKLFFIFSRLKADLEIDVESKTSKLGLAGAATFVRLPVLAMELDRVPRGHELHVDFERLTLIDHACLNLLMSWDKQHQTSGGRLVIDWDSLHMRFASDGSGPIARAATSRKRLETVEAGSTSAATADGASVENQSQPEEGRAVGLARK